MVILIIFLLAALLGAMLLSAAIVVWLWEVALPLYWALFIVGVIYIIIALAIYNSSLRWRIEGWQRRLNVVYKVSATLDTIYKNIVDTIKRFVGGI